MASSSRLGSTRVIVAAMVAAAIAVGGCRGGTKAPDAGAQKSGEVRAVRDAVGRDVRVPSRARRIVSLAPAITEILFAAGAGERVVGVTRYCNFPPAADALPEVGGFADPDVERVAQLAPDLVIATADTVARDRFDALVALGVPVYATDASDFAGVVSSIRNVAAVAGNAEAGEALAKRFEERRDAVLARVKGRPLRRTLFLFQANPAIAAGPDTFLDELLRTAGGENVAASSPTSYPRLGLEGIVVLAPDVILTTMPETAATLRKSLAGSPLASHEILSVEADRVERPGPRLVEGLEAVAGILHPEAFDGTRE